VPLSVDEPCRDMVPVGGRLVPADRCAFLGTRAVWCRRGELLVSVRWGSEAEVLEGWRDRIGAVGHLLLIDNQLVTGRKASICTVSAR